MMGDFANYLPALPPPPQRLTSTQFSKAELTAIVEEAEAAGTYVCAHAYMPDAIRRAVECGVRRCDDYGEKRRGRVSGV